MGGMKALDALVRIFVYLELALFGALIALGAALNYGVTLPNPRFTYSLPVVSGYVIAGGATVVFSLFRIGRILRQAMKP